MSTSTTTADATASSSTTAPAPFVPVTLPPVVAQTLQQQLTNMGIMFADEIVMIVSDQNNLFKATKFQMENNFTKLDNPIFKLCVYLSINLAADLGVTNGGITQLMKLRDGMTAVAKNNRVREINSQGIVYPTQRWLYLWDNVLKKFQKPVGGFLGVCRSKCTAAYGAVHNAYTGGRILCNTDNVSAQIAPFRNGSRLWKLSLVSKLCTLSAMLGAKALATLNAQKQRSGQRRAEKNMELMRNAGLIQQNAPGTRQNQALAVYDRYMNKKGKKSRRGGFNGMARGDFNNNNNFRRNNQPQMWQGNNGNFNNNYNRGGGRGRGRGRQTNNNRNGNNRQQQQNDDDVEVMDDDEQNVTTDGNNSNGRKEKRNNPKTRMVRAFAQLIKHVRSVCKFGKKAGGDLGELCNILDNCMRTTTNDERFERFKTMLHESIDNIYNLGIPHVFSKEYTIENEATYLLTPEYMYYIMYPNETKQEYVDRHNFVTLGHVDGVWPKTLTIDLDLTDRKTEFVIISEATNFRTGPVKGAKRIVRQRVQRAVSKTLTIRSVEVKQLEFKPIKTVQVLNGKAVAIEKVDLDNNFNNSMVKLKNLLNRVNPFNFELLTEVMRGNKKASFGEPDERHSLPPLKITKKLPTASVTDAEAGEDITDK